MHDRDRKLGWVNRGELYPAEDEGDDTGEKCGTQPRNQTEP